MEETYKTIKDYPNYEVSNLGNVRNIKTGRVLRPNTDKNGYPKVKLYKDGEAKVLSVHRLVANAFIENPENKSCVNHINGCKTDNYVSNLEWVTSSENQKHAYENGLKKQSDKNPFKANNPTPKQRVRCIETGQEFESQCQASKYFGCGQGSIWQSIHKGWDCKGYHFKII